MTTEATMSHRLGEVRLAELEHDLHGELIRPLDDPYDEAHVIWNGAQDRRRVLIVRCAGRSVSRIPTGLELAGSVRKDTGRNKTPRRPQT